MLRWPRRNRPWPADRQAVGALGERFAARHLKRAGLRVLVRNFDSPAGQIDLIASDRETLVFVEVKTRTHDEAGEEDGDMPVRRFQCEQITRAAKYFCLQPAARHRPCRFDVITVALLPHGKFHIEHVEDAWQPSRH